jgi:predicted DNA-binding protein
MRIPLSLDHRVDKLAARFGNTRSRVGQAALLMGIRDLERTLDMVEDTPEDIRDEFKALVDIGEVDTAVRLWNERQAS